MSVMDKPPSLVRTHHRFQKIWSFCGKNCGRSHLKSPPCLQNVRRKKPLPNYVRLLWTAPNIAKSQQQQHLTKVKSNHNFAQKSRFLTYPLWLGKVQKLSKMVWMHEIRVWYLPRWPPWSLSKPCCYPTYCFVWVNFSAWVNCFLEIY